MPRMMHCLRGSKVAHGILLLVFCRLAASASELPMIFLDSAKVMSNLNGSPYNYCKMPHVNRSKYKTLDSSFKLKYVEVIHRHHLRTPYSSNTFPLEGVQWNCSDTHPRRYLGVLGDAASPVAIDWVVGYDSANPFYEPFGFVESDCYFPQLTNQGYCNSVEHGADLRNVYIDVLGFVPDHADSSKVAFRVTNNDITSQVLGGVIAGLFPDTKEHTATVQLPSFDSLEPTYPCPKASSLLSSMKSSPAWTAHLEESSHLLSKLDSISGVDPDDDGWHSSFDHYFDNLSTKECHAMALPCHLMDKDFCITREEADQVYALGHWEYDYLYRKAPEALEYSRLRYGAFLLELKSHLLASVDSTSEIIYRHNVAHDGSVALLLGALQVEEMVWPGLFQFST